MVSNYKITISADTVVDERKVAAHAAVLDLDNKELSLYFRQVDKAACEENKELVRADRASFEDFAYATKNHYLK